ncbi:MAG: filamentous hemagglutinin N-terminal domain-containing protein [Candidatus Marithrix sp.]
MTLYYKTIPLSFIFISVVSAEIILDGTLGPQIELIGPNFAIEANLGQQHGGNLFHSFNQFDINKGEIATFYGPSNINNIISRVTGGRLSNIDGIIRSAISNADFYFLNPHGIMFGPSAKLDISGSFHASTADYLRLEDTGRFDVHIPENSILTVAPVHTFGFLTNNPAAITLQDSTLSVVEGKTLSLIGGDLIMKGEVLSISGQVPIISKNFTTEITAPNGRLNFASIASKGDVHLTELGLDINAKTGDFIIDHSKITTSGIGGGDIFIRAGLLKLINSDITVDTFGGQNAGIVDIQASNLILDGKENYSYISSSSFGAGHGGEINLFADQFSLSNGAVLFTGGVSSGNAGSISIKVTDTLIFSGKFLPEILTSSVFSSSTLGTGQGGDITIEAHDITIINGGQIISGTFSSAKSGDVTVKIKDTLTISGKDEAGLMSSILASTSPLIVIDPTYNTGDGGTINVEAKAINLSDGGQISTASVGLGNAGLIKVKTNKLTASGKAFSNFWGRYFPSGISSSSLVTDEIGGNAGDIIINADTINLINEGEIGTSAANSGGGNIEITTTDLVYLQDGQITTSVRDGIGNSGNITIKNPLFIILNNGKIKAQADAGHGGNINIKTEQFITSPNSLISASSKLGLDGKVNIESLDIDMEGFLVLLPDDVVEASNLMQKPCSMRGSSFIARKINGSSQTPYDYQAARYLPKDNEQTIIIFNNSEKNLALASICK